MEEKLIKEHHLAREINDLKNKLTRLGAIVEESLVKSIESFLNRDVEIAKRVIRLDSEVDELEVHIEEDCLKILALHQPVAIDLRYIIGVLKVNNDLERIGDLSVNIAKTSKKLMKIVPVKLLDSMVLTIELVKKMLKKSLDAFVQSNTDLAYQLMEEDNEVDRLHKKTTKKVLSKIITDNKNSVNWLQMLTISRYLERIADYATNIAEDVLYMVEGEIKRHTQ